MIETNGQSEKFKGSSPSIAPLALPLGIFSLCSGGVPNQGTFAKLPGKTLKDTGSSTGGVISIYSFGTKVVVQKYIGIEIFDLRTLIPRVEDFVYDNESNLVYDNSGLPVTQ